jgi:hypothetical protein
MGKRSSTFERRPADYYPTPPSAVLPLLPHLRGIRTFAEPCAGDGALVRHLESYGLRCVYAGDIAAGKDALAVDDYGQIDAIITNPPYTRDLMHRLIAHFQRIAPTWLLLDSDWASTRQAAPFLPSCSDIVAIGRVKWFEGTKHTGKDNYAWYRFDTRHSSGPVFRGREQSDTVPSRRTRACEQCGKAYEPLRSSSRFCSERCRQRAHRHKVSVTSSVTPAPLAHEEFRYVLHDDVEQYTADGSESLPALHGTHHGEYAVLMRRRIQQNDDRARSLIG